MPHLTSLALYGLAVVASNAVAQSTCPCFTATTTTSVVPDDCTDVPACVIQYSTTVPARNAKCRSTATVTSTATICGEDICSGFWFTYTASSTCLATTTSNACALPPGFQVPDGLSGFLTLGPGCTGVGTTTTTTPSSAPTTTQAPPPPPPPTTTSKPSPSSTPQPPPKPTTTPTTIKTTTTPKPQTSTPAPPPPTSAGNCLTYTVTNTPTARSCVKPNCIEFATVTVPASVNGCGKVPTVTVNAPTAKSCPTCTTILQTVTGRPGAQTSGPALTFIPPGNNGGFGNGNGNGNGNGGGLTFEPANGGSDFTVPVVESDGGRNTRRTTACRGRNCDSSITWYAA